MTPRRTHPRVAVIAAIALPVLTPGAFALAGSDGDVAPTTSPAASTPVLIAEQVSTARQIVPFGSAGTSPDAPRTVWAFGRTRAASTIVGTTPTPPTATTPSEAVLLQGTIGADDQPTAWARTAPPLDVTGAPLEAGSWRPADGTSAAATAPPATTARLLRNGGATPNGASALLVRIQPGGGAPTRTAVLARTSDRRFREIPSPPTELVAPAADAFAGPSDRVAPFAVIDAPVDDSADQRAGDRGRTAVLLAPAGGDGVLRWNGTRWSEDPWVDADGTPTGARSAIALAATPTGDAVAMFAGDPTAPDAARVALVRHDPAGNAFAPVPIGGSRLLEGALPSGIRSIEPVAAPGQPLTVAGKHWWIDLMVTRSDDRRVSTTVHVQPPTRAVVPGTSPTTPTTPTTPTSPDATSPTDATTPAPTSTTPTNAAVTGTWCTPSLPQGSGCDRPLGYEFATTRGYASAAFDGASTGPGGFGERAISSPVIPESKAGTTPPEASASGGYLQLAGTRFALRSGIGDDGTSDAGGTQAATFARGGFAVVAGDRAVGRTMLQAAQRTDALRQNGPGFPDGALDVALSPPGTPADQAGAFSLSLTMGLQRQQGTEEWRSIDYGFPERPKTAGRAARGAVPSAIAWGTPQRIILAGPAGLLLEMDTPPATRRFGNAPEQPKHRYIDVADDDLLDVAAQGEEAWAVGRRGVAWHRQAGGGWSKSALPAAFRNTTLTSVAFAGARVLIASERGVLTVDPGTDTLRVDEELAALMRADERAVSARVVAGLPDGAAVVDGRYVRTNDDTAWRRLTSPVEGDVVALSLWRDTSPGAGIERPTTPAPTDPAPTGAADPSGAPAAPGGLRIAASIADVARPSVGLTREIRTGPDAGDVQQFEEPPVVTDGRVATLGANGWVDRARTPIAPSIGRDLAARVPPITAIATDVSGDGWVAGGSGTLFDLMDETTLSVPELFLAPLGNAPFDQRPADERPVGRRARQLSEPVPNATTIRVLVGGHPACLDECAGRGDQGLAPDANVEDALVTAEKVGQPGEGTPPALVVFAGGRAGGGLGLSRAGAQRYLELLRSHPTVPVALGIGTGDAVSPESRAAFADAARELLAERAAAPGSAVTQPTTPQAPIDTPGSDTVAYALDAAGLGDNSFARVVVIDNAGGKLRGGMDGAQARWLGRVLADPEAAARSTVVIGAARLDGAGGVQASDREEELSLLGQAGADVYIATDGPDDPTNEYFGAATVRYPTDRTHGNPIAMYRTAGLGHQRPLGLFADFNGTRSENADTAAGWQSPALVDVQMTGVLNDRPDVSALPVLTSLVPQPTELRTGSAEYIIFPGATRAGTGMRVPPNNRRQPLLPGPTDGDDEGPPGATTPKPTTPEPPAATTPEPTTPEPTTPDDTPASTTPVEARAPGWVYAAPFPCRLFSDDEFCRGQLPIDVSYEVLDPSVAVFVRARPQAKPDTPPIIVADPNGDPIVDRTSAVLCALKPGTTTMVIRVAGRTATYPLTIGGSRPPDAAPDKGAAKQAPCAFRWGTTVVKNEEKPGPTTPSSGGTPPVVEPAPEPQPGPRAEPQPPVVAPRPLVAIPPAVVGFAPFTASGGAAPPVAPNPKPVAANAPPAPPSGVSTQQVPAPQTSMQVQTFAVTAEERRSELAREGAEHQATALSHRSPRVETARAAEPAPRADASASRPPAASPGGIDATPTYRSTADSTTPLIAGGLLALLTALAGHAAGRRRQARARARRRGWLR